MRRVLTAAEMRAVDAAATGLGMPAAVLMENAGRALADASAARAGPGGRVVVVCGTGHNGGDGLVAARWLKAGGRAVLVELVGDPTALAGEPRRTWEALWALGPVEAPPASFAAAPGDVVVDALLGTGLSRPPRGPQAAAIERINRWRAQGAAVVAADLPSGLDADSGRPFDPCVEADLTVTFGRHKVGVLVEPGATRCGRVELAEIGIPAAAEAGLSGATLHLLEEASVRALLPPRRADTHKGSYGHVLVVAGSPGKTGAAALAALGALRGGAGLVSVATRPAELAAIQAHAPEVMGVALPGEGPLGKRDLEALVAAAAGKAALVVGPGLAMDREPLLELVKASRGPVVLDADGLNALQGQPAALLGNPAGLVLTPHPGEAARLTRRGVAEVQGDRLGLARRLAVEAGAVVVLKGARTVVASPDGSARLNPTGNPGMSTAGTGDVLAGLTGALLGQGLALADAASVAVYAHGLAGDLARATRGELGLIASDLLDGLGQVWSRWGR